MRRLSLLRRSAAAVIGGTALNTRTTVLTPALELGVARRAAAAVIGIRSYSSQPTTTAAAAGTSHPAGSSAASSRIWEIRRPTGDITRRSIHTAPPPQAWKGTATGLELVHYDDPQPDASDWLTVVLNPASPMVIDTSDTPAQPRRPRHVFALAAMAAVFAIFFTVFGYQLHPLVHRQTPSSPVGSDEPSPTPSASSDKTSPTPVTEGVVPDTFLGTWTATVSNESGEHTRTMVITQGGIGDDVLIVTADGSNYHCVFMAALTAPPSAGRNRLEIGPSIVTSGTSPVCKPGVRSVVSLKSDGRLVRNSVPYSASNSLSYTRAQ
ncbi:hypothetical protein [Streptomyces aureus]|uniref:hypothetical protein n=1 Tax=Streptomyces aureus TaxID=193461 RepID=UPI0005691853|nr:hypothetical protein [Streptomyces aureus]